MTPVQIRRATYEDKVDTLARAAIAAGEISFSGLLKMLPSVYPTELLAAVGRLSARALIPVEFAALIHDQARTFRAEAGSKSSLLPLPHPLDFEWRFTPATSQKLINIAADLTAYGENILLFGTPGVALEALALPIDRRLSFQAEDNPVTHRVIALNRAVGSPLNVAFCEAGLMGDSADAVILDPPWYPDFIRPMMAAAAAACRIGGSILISIPPVGTRPGVDADREAIIRFAARLGLALTEHLPLALSYDTPFFETNALVAAGIYAPHGWRRGDLLIFRRVRAASRTLPIVKGQRRDWVEVAIGRMRVFVKCDDIVPEAGEGLSALIDGDILPTVSRRDRRRRRAQIWTSGNRIFRTGNPKLILDAALLQGLDGNGSSAQPQLWGSQYAEALERVGRELSDLAEREANEERHWAAFTPERSALCTSNSTSFWTGSPITTFG
jgi:hypothetical protein